MGIRATQNLGHYLGVPLLHGRITRTTYDFLLTRLDDKLAGWKANTLSLAGRVILASSVLNSIPSYVMQTAALPAHICGGIDRKIRNFIWGSTNVARKIHNINWDMVCRSKSLGGLGLRSARDLNRAFIMKLIWGILSRPEELWVKVLTSKYLKRTDYGSILLVIGMQPPKSSSGEDRLVWGLEDKGIFRSKLLTCFLRISIQAKRSMIGVWLGGGEAPIESSILSGLLATTVSSLMKNGTVDTSQTRLFAPDVQFILNPCHM
ncbi:Putative ribonuclease H protein At1g65750 [Linum perenne]